MKKYFHLLLVVLCFYSFEVKSQPSGKKERVKALKTAFITNELGLTPTEAEKFWPIYNAFEEKQFELRHEKMRSYLNRMNTDIDQMNEKEASQLLSQMESVEEELYQIRRKLIQDLRNVLPIHKIIKLRKAEEDFNRDLLRQMRESRPSPKRN